MFHYDYRQDLDVGRVCLELSLKPFYDLAEDRIEKTCYELFDGWRELLRYASSCAVLLWTSDGSEILEYRGLDEEFEWCRYIGIGNPLKDPEKNGYDTKRLHVRPILYRENPPIMHYRDLKHIIASLKKVGKEQFGLDVTVGETFDPGPEFAYSVFKYERHAEIAKGDIMGNKQWLHCAARLHEDHMRYAAYPDGIPEGTHFGEFLGRQFMAMKQDLGFDYLWLSNGFGFSLSSWDWVGELFDGEKYDFTHAKAVREAIQEFWTHFLKEVEGLPIETRGSNLSTGMDIAAHGCPIDSIYEYNIVAPPNSPWAAMDYRFGLEMVGYMSHIAHLPKGGYNFRYYTHDPWWLNSPWFDRYGRSPHDIYLPLAIARMDEKGQCTPPIGVQFLSADDSFGKMPRKLGIEVTPYLLEAFNDRPDEPGLVTWVYPFDYYCKLGLQDGRPDRVMMDDWFVESAIDQGFPVNTVVSDANFAKSDLTVYRKTILLMPVPDAGTPLEASLLRALDGGLNVILFGDTSGASDAIRTLLGVQLSQERSGDFVLRTDCFADTFTCEDSSVLHEYDCRPDTDRPCISNILHHDPVVSAGGIRETATGMAEVLASVLHRDTKEERVYMTANRNAGNGSTIVWIRGSFPHRRASEGHLPPLVDLNKNFNPSVLLRSALALFGYTIAFDAYSSHDKLPLIFHSRRENASFLTGFAKDSTVMTRMSYPDGAPMPLDTEFMIENDIGTYPTKKWWHSECRAFIKQKQKGKIIVQTVCPESYIHIDRRMFINGLVDAQVTFYAPKGGAARFILNHPFCHIDSNVPLTITQDGTKYVAEHLTGSLSITWEYDKEDNDFKKLQFLEPKN